MRIRATGTRPEKPAAFAGIAADAKIGIMTELNRYITMRGCDRAKCTPDDSVTPVHI
jgi:hypothetical protein